MENKKLSVIEVLGIDRALTVLNLIVETEYNATIEGDWAYYELEGNSSTPESVADAKNFLAMTLDDKKAYTMNHAIDYTAELMTDINELLRAYDGDFFRDSIKIDVESLRDKYIQGL